jgi:hypothetical protein
MASAVLHHNDRIGAFGQRRSGHDLDRFSGLDYAFESLAGAHFADDPHAPGHVARPHREAIPYGSVKRRIIAVGRYVFREDTAGGSFDRNGFSAWDTARGAHFAQHGSASVEKRQSRHAY